MHAVTAGATGALEVGDGAAEPRAPVEAGLVWSIGKRRREEGGFPGFARISRELREGAKRKRVGIRPEGRAPVREGAAVHLPGGARIGSITSGGFGATAGGPVAMGYVDAAHAAPGQALELELRGRAVAASIVPLPFVAHRYHKG